MRKIEKAPDWFKDELYEKATNLRKSHNFDTLLNHIDDQYMYWDKVKYQKNDPPIDPDVLWTLVKINRINAIKINFGQETFKFNLTNTIQKGLHEFDLHIGGSLASESVIPKEDKKKYLVSSIMEEAIASSQIEGAVTSRKKAKDMLRKNITPRNKSEQMILNNYHTIKHIVAIQSEHIDINNFFEIHRLVTAQTLDDTADVGRFRLNNEINVVDAVDGEIVYSPPGFQKVPDLIQELFNFFNNNDEARFIHPIIKGCIIHFMIGYIHPFVDGNGRTARALFYWYLLKNGYWLTEYLSISRLIAKSKNQYAQAYIYSEVDGNDLTYFIQYKIKTMQLAYSSLKDYINRKIIEKKQLTNFQRIKGVNERQAQILKWANEEDSIFSVKEIENRFSVSNQTARTDLSELVKKGYLEENSMNKKTKRFYKSSNFEKLLKKELATTVKI